MVLRASVGTCSDGHFTVWDGCGANGHGWPQKGPPQKPKMGTPQGQRGLLGSKSALPVNKAGWRRSRATQGRYGGAGGRFGPLLAISGPPPPPPPHLRGPPRGPAKGVCRGIRILRRPCVGEETPCPRPCSLAENVLPKSGS